MNILQVLPELNSGGVETGTLDLAKELVRQGHKAVIISNGGNLVEDLEALGGIHYKLPVHEKHPLTVISMVGKIKEIIQREKISLVHARSRAPAFSAFFASYLMNVPFITTCHGHYSKHIFSRVMGWGRFVIVSSNLIARHMINDFKVPRDRIRLVPRGVDLEKFIYKDPVLTKSKQVYTIGIVGRITPIKGHAYLIRAIAKVIKQIPNIKVLIIGEAPADKPRYRNELELLVRRLSLSQYIHFMGNRNDIPQQLAEMDLLVMPSVGEEAFGRAIIEAQACGVPVIATRVGGIIDIIDDNENGILVSPRDWNRLSDAIINVLKDDNLKQRFSKNGKMNVEKNFSLLDMYKKTVKVYNEALSSFRVLVIKWSALGDILLSIQAIRSIRMRFPKADILCLTSRTGKELLSRYSYVDEFFIFKGNRGLNGLRQLLEVSSTLRMSSVNMVIDLQNNKKSHLISFLSAAPVRIGYKSRKIDFLMNQTIEGADLPISPIAHQFRLLKLVGVDEKEPYSPLIISEEEKKYAESLLSEGWVGKNERLVGINCGASQRWQTKWLPINKLAKLCDMLAQKQIRIVITGTKEDKPKARELLLLTRSKPLDLTGRTGIMQLGALIQRCNVFVTSDSAPMHLAALIGVPFVALFGPTDPKRHMEPCKEHRVIYKSLKCSPCYKPKCPHKRCMESIEPEEIAAAVMELMNGNSV